MLNDWYQPHLSMHIWILSCRQISWLYCQTAGCRLPQLMSNVNACSVCGEPGVPYPSNCYQTPSSVHQYQRKGWLANWVCAIGFLCHQRTYASKKVSLMSSSIQWARSNWIRAQQYCWAWSFASVQAWASSPWNSTLENSWCLHVFIMDVPPGRFDAGFNTLPRCYLGISGWNLRQSFRDIFQGYSSMSIV